MTTVQPGQVVDLDGQAYLVLGKTTTEYDVGTKVLIECEHLTIDPATSTVKIEGVEVVGRGNGQAVDSLTSLLFNNEGEKDYSSVIIALVPHLPITTRLVQKVKGALPVADLHVTLCHLGKARSLSANRATIEDILQEIASVTPPIRYKVGGHGRFLGVGDNSEDAVYASVDSPQLPDLYDKLTQALEAAGIDVSSNHGFTPHITLAYTDDKKWVPDLKPMYGVADRLVLFWAGEQKGFQLRGSVGYVKKRQSEKARWVTIRGKPVMIKGPRKPTGKSLASSTFISADRPRQDMLTGKETPAKGPTLSGALEAQLKTWEGDRASIAKSALYSYQTGTEDLIVTKDGNEAVGVAGVSPKRWDGLRLGPAYSYEPDIDEQGIFREVYDVATKRKGYGNQTMVELAREVSKDGSGLFLKSVPDAAGFYKAIGMREGVDRFGAHVFYWTPEDLQFVTSEGEKAKSPADLEPEDGVFVDSKRGKQGKKGRSTPTSKTRWRTLKNGIRIPIVGTHRGGARPGVTWDPKDLPSNWQTAVHDEEGIVDPDAVAERVAKAIEASPGRMVHGNTAQNAFYLVDDESYAWNKWRDIPSDKKVQAIAVHSHGGSNWEDYTTRTGELESFQPLNSEDVHLWLKGIRSGQMAPVQALIMPDGRMDILELLPSTDPAVFKLGAKRLQSMVEATYEEASRRYKADPSMTRDNVHREKLRSWADKYGIRFMEGYSWRTTPQLERHIEGLKEMPEVGKKSIPSLGRDHTRRGRWRTLKDGLLVLIEGITRTRSKDIPSISVDTKKGRWITIRGRPIFIAKGRGTKPGAGGATRLDKDRWGAMSVEDRRDKWEALTQSQRDDIADASTSIPEHQASLISHAGARPDLEGDDVSSAIDSRLDTLTTKNGEEYIPATDAELIKSTVHDFDSVLSEAGLTPAQRHALTMEAADALVAQDREAMGRTLGDHGIHHLRGNIDNTMGILAAHPDADPAEAKAAAYVANIFHDTGYMAPPAQMFLDSGHPRWSQQHYDENLRPLVKDAFGGRFAGSVSHLIRTHDSTNVNWNEDVLGSAVRVADNVALFQKQKLPALFRHVPGSTGILEQLAAKRIDAKTAQQMLKTGLAKTKLSSSIKTQLSKGIPEVFSLTPKFTLGMLGGDILGFGWNKGALTIRLGRNADADRLQKMLDLGQRQFAKFAKTYGMDPDQFSKSLQFEFKDSKGRTVLQSTIEEMKALLEWLGDKGLVLSGMVEGQKAKGRWRTLKDGRHVQVTGSIRSGITIGGGRTKLTIKGKVGQRKIQAAVDAFEALPAWQRRNVKGLTLDADKGYGVTVGGQNYTAGADWSANNVINIYNANKANKREMTRRISHEAGHAAFDQWRAGATGEYLERARFDHPEWITKGDPFNPRDRDRIKPQYLDQAAKVYPHFAVQARFQQAFQRQDGVTPYSKQWTRQEGRDSHVAMTETFAELSEMYSRMAQRNGERSARSMLPSMAGARDVAGVFLDVVDLMDRSRGSKAVDIKATTRRGKRIARATFNDKWEPVPPGSRATHLVEIETDKDDVVKRVTYFDAETTGIKATKLPKSGGRWRTLRNGRRVYIANQENK